jgi:hypothetical protein
MATRAQTLAVRRAAAIVAARRPVQIDVSPPPETAGDAHLWVAWDGRWPKGQPVYASWKHEIQSLVVGGAMGSGKTSTLVFYVTQAVQQGFRLAVVDAHLGNDESLATRLAPLKAAGFLPNGAAFVGRKGGVELIRRFGMELERRIERGEELHAEGRSWTPETDGDPPLLLVVDELNALLREHGKIIRPILEMIPEQGRKYWMFAVLGGQHWTVQALGSSEVRDTFPSVIVHSMRDDHARMLMGANGLGLTTVGLAPGQVYMSLAGRHPSHRKPMLVAIPQITDEDVRKVGAELAAAQQQPLLVTSSTALNKTGEVEAMLRSDPARVIRLWEQGARPGEVVRRMCSRLADNRGRAHVAGTAVVDEIIRDHVLRLETRMAAIERQPEPALEPAEVPA